jgi:serine phosphatase RsbU (regulator of sigma subunit)/predicted membrane protein
LMLGLPAYLGGIYLSHRHTPEVRLGIAIDRGMAIERAQEYASEIGFPVIGWKAFVITRNQDDLHFYYRKQAIEAPEQGGQGWRIGARFAPQVTVGVKFRAPDGSESVEVHLDLQGEPLGFEQTVSRVVPTADLGELEAQRVALRAIRARIRGTGIEAPTKLPLGEIVRGEIATRRYVWRWKLPEAPELQLQSELKVRGTRLVADLVTASIEPQYARKNLKGDSPLKTVSVILYSLAVFLVILFGIFRFVQRVQEKEVSYTRSIIFGILVAVILSVTLLTTDLPTYDTLANPDFPLPEWSVIFSVLFTHLLVGLFLGLAYASGEGDLREPYPGKLASLDALLTGKLFSRNVARAFVIGWAMGGWIFLFQEMAIAPWALGGIWGPEISPLDSWFGKAPWLFGLFGWLSDVILVIIIGLLLPLPFLYRRLGSRRVVIPTVALTLWIACSAPYLPLRPWEVVLVFAIPRMAFTLLSFLEFDLLTAVIALAVPSFVGHTVSLLSQPVPSLYHAGVTSLLLALALLLLHLILSFRGRSYREEEVRPVYARFLAERLALQAEVSAAREAQVRLMPERIPTFPHFAIAAECLPAFEVGGDFYDLIELEPGKIAVLIAEGAGQGLGSALSIAFAKGFLLPKIKGDPARDPSPTELMRQLRNQLSPRVDEESQLGFVLAMIDAHDRTLRYARTGSFPIVRLVFASPESSPEGISLVEPTEISRTFPVELPAGLREPLPIQIVEGQVELPLGSCVLFLTDGIVKNFAQQEMDLDQVFPPMIGDPIHSTQSDLQESLTRTVKQIAKLSRRAGAEDDLTAVIVRIEG